MSHVKQRLQHQKLSLLIMLCCFVSMTTTMQCEPGSYVTPNEDYMLTNAEFQIVTNDKVYIYIGNETSVNKLIGR